MLLVEHIYAQTQRFPKSEQFGLTQQLQRSAISVPSNIAEGHARGGTKDFLRFLSIARGSLAELETQLILAERLDLMSSDAVNELLGEADEISRMLRGLEHSLERRLTR
jgi:four helix bundle protein